MDPVGASGVFVAATCNSRVAVEPVGDSGVVIAAVEDYGVDVTTVGTLVLLWLHSAPLEWPLLGYIQYYRQY